MASFVRSINVFGLHGDTEFTQLNAEKILFTIGVLQNRINERFPSSGLLRVCREFNQLAQTLEIRAKELRHPIWLVRLGSILAVVAILFLFGYTTIWSIWSQSDLPDYKPTELVSATEITD